MLPDHFILKIKKIKNSLVTHRVRKVVLFILPFLVFIASIYVTPTTTTIAQSPTCPKSHPYLCDDIGPSGEEVCSTEVDCSSNNITVGSTSGPDCRQNPGYCETLSPSCPSGGGGTVTCNPNTGWCETVSCSQGLDPSSSRYQSNSNMVETRVGDPGRSEDGGANNVNPSALKGWPVEGNFRISQCPYSGGFTHGTMNAIDIIMPEGTPIYSTLDGVITTKVVTSCNSHDNLCADPTGYGTYVIVQGDEMWALYAHFLSNSVSHLAEGQNIKAGDYLGGMGNTGYSSGTHLHYELQHGFTFPQEQNICI